MNIQDELDEIREKAIELRNYTSWSLYNKHMYKWVRREEPELMAEAGVAGGATSFVILKAMQENGKGRLYSFDPGHEHVGDDEHLEFANEEFKEHPPGALIPDELKDRWNFYKMKFVDGKEILEEVAVSEQKFDAFFHDSDHSDENINAEFEMMKKLVKEDGYFMIHDRPTEKVWNEFELVEGVNEFEMLTKGVDPEYMQEGATRWALKIFKRGEN